MKKALLISIIALTFLNIGCSVKKEESKVSDQYTLTENGCPTGTHVFTGSSEEEVRAQKCAALEDDALNDYCAYNLREAMYNRECI